MNVESRITKLERLLTIVSHHRARVLAAGAGTADERTGAAGWNRLEQNFRAALLSATRQRERVEVGLSP